MVDCSWYIVHHMYMSGQASYGTYTRVVYSTMYLHVIKYNSCGLRKCCHTQLVAQEKHASIIAAWRRLL